MISPAELQKGAQWLGLHLPAAEMVELVTMFDSDGDGSITLEVSEVDSIGTICYAACCELSGNTMGTAL